MTYIKFSHDYEKLNDDEFTTIRRYDRYELNEHIQVKTPTQEFPAIIWAKLKMTLPTMEDDFLCYDTGGSTREEAIKILNSFYRNSIREDEALTVLVLRKVLIVRGKRRNEFFTITCRYK